LKKSNKPRTKTEKKLIEKKPSLLDMLKDRKNSLFNFICPTNAKHIKEVEKEEKLNQKRNKSPILLKEIDPDYKFSVNNYN